MTNRKINLRKVSPTLVLFVNQKLEFESQGLKITWAVGPQVRKILKYQSVATEPEKLNNVSLQ